MAGFDKDKSKKTLSVDGTDYTYFSISALEDPRVARLPFSIRILLEAAIRNCDGFHVTAQDVENILNWEVTSKEDKEIPFKPARVLMQDFTGVPAVVDLAAMRDAMKRLGGDENKINPLVPVDLVIDHSVVVDHARTADAREKNEEKEFERNYERFKFLKWGQSAFKNMLIVPPGSGIVHQVNLEYLARSVFCNEDNVLYPDSLVGTDSHTTMVNGLGVFGWGVGGIEAEAVMLGQTMSMVLPKVVGYKLTGKPQPSVTATDIVLTATANLRKHGVVGKFVEFFGPGCEALSLSDRATLSNMAPEYGATMGFFGVDGQTLNFLRQTGRSEHVVKRVEAYLRAQNLYRENVADPVYSELLELDLSTVEACLAGPKRPQDYVPLKDMQKDFNECMNTKRGFKGFGVAADNMEKKVPFDFEGKKYEFSHGSVVIAAITSCTNTSNPNVMLGAGLVAKKAVEAGLEVPPYIKTSLSPGSWVATQYLEKSGLSNYLAKLGFTTAGYGCMTCIGNSGEIPSQIHELIQKEDMVAAAVLSGNRNFEARVHPLTQGNYLASPPLVVVYALAGSVNKDFSKEPVGHTKDGKPVMLADIWPSNEEVSAIVEQNVLPEMYKDVYSKIQQGTPRWNQLDAPTASLYPWDEASTYIHNPPFFKTMNVEPEARGAIENAYCLLNLADSITTDHISPAGVIARSSPAQRYLAERGVDVKDFNSYGSRRGNDEVMARGTFANTRLNNKMVGKNGPRTIHVPSGEEMDVFDAAAKYQSEKNPLIVLAGAEYGSGSSRDWAAKGPYLQGVQAVIAVSYERIHRSNLVGMGIIPLQFKEGESADSLNLTGKEQFTVNMPAEISPGMDITVSVNDGRSFTTKLRFDTQVDVTYFKHGGILRYVLRNLLKQ